MQGSLEEQQWLRNEAAGAQGEGNWCNGDGLPSQLSQLLAADGPGGGHGVLRRMLPYMEWLLMPYGFDMGAVARMGVGFGCCREEARLGPISEVGVFGGAALVRLGA